MIFRTSNYQYRFMTCKCLEVAKASLKMESHDSEVLWERQRKTVPLNTGNGSIANKYVCFKIQIFIKVIQFY